MDSILASLLQKKLAHPVVVVLGCRQEVGQVFLAVEGSALPVSRGVVSAVSALLKLHFILNMEYSSECRHILHFLQRSVMGVADDLPLSRAAVELSMFIRNKKKRN